MKNKSIEKTYDYGIDMQYDTDYGARSCDSSRRGAADASRFRGKTVREWEVWEGETKQDDTQKTAEKKVSKER